MPPSLCIVIWGWRKLRALINALDALSDQPHMRVTFCALGSGGTEIETYQMPEPVTDDILQSEAWRDFDARHPEPEYFSWRIEVGDKGGPDYTELAVTRVGTDEEGVGRYA